MAETVKPLTRAEYDALTPRQQGYASYMQGAWNSNVPNFNDYRVGTKAREEFSRGEAAAMMEAQEGDDG